LADYLDAAAPDAVERMGASALAKLPGLADLVRLESHRRWLALEGVVPSPAQSVGLSLAFAGLGIVLAVVTSAPIAGLLGMVGAVVPFARIRSQANRIKRRVQRSLPELTALLAAEMAAGNPPDKALERAAEWGGPLAILVRTVAEDARATGRPIFGRGSKDGALVRTVSAYDLPALRAFAAQIDLAARKGAAGPELMEGLAKTLIIEFKDRALREAEALDSKLAVPSVLFFFLPFLFLMLVPLMWPVLQVL
jgi:Flp pilus assembly protein TadB